MRDKRRIKDIVMTILLDDENARNNDRYLYSEVVRRTNPELLNVPFVLAITSKQIPSFETVRRSRQYAQEHFPNVCANSTVEAMRGLEEKSYKEVFANGRMDKSL